MCAYLLVPIWPFARVTVGSLFAWLNQLFWTNRCCCYYSSLFHSVFCLVADVDFLTQLVNFSLDLGAASAGGGPGPAHQQQQQLPGNGRNGRSLSRSETAGSSSGGGTGIGLLPEQHHRSSGYYGTDMERSVYSERDRGYLSDMSSR